jgi:hypothetical protein
MRWCSIAASRGLACRALGVSGFTIGYVGRLENAKGLAKVATAVARCRAQPILPLLGTRPEPSRPLKQMAEFMRASMY